MINFIHPWMLAGLAALGLPVLIHFLTRPRPRVIPYPTYHFLVEAGSGRQALDRLRTWIVLALRTLAVAALVLLFAQPFFRSPGVVSEPGQPRRVVLVVDGSMSMCAVESGVPIFARARAQAADVLRSLDQGSSAAVVFIGAEPRSVLPALSTNLASLHEGLASAQPTLEKGDPAAALALASRLLAGQGAIYIFSDFQRTNWASVDLARISSPDASDASSPIAFFLRPVVSRPVDNVGITSIEKSPGEPVEGQTIELTASVFNSTPAARKESVRVDLEGVGQTADVELPPYSSGAVTFSFALPTAGCYPGRLSLQPDDLNDDNTRYFKIRVRKTLDVLVISDSDRDDPAGGAFFIATALAPSEYVPTGLRILRRRGQEVDRTSLETADVFFIVPPARLAGDVVDIIARRVADGASLLCFLDGNSSPETLSALAGASKGAITPPFQLLRTVSTRESAGEPFGDVLTVHGPLKLFHSSDQGDLMGLRFRRHFLAETVSGRKDEVLVSFQDGSPALSLSPAGRGLTVFVNFPAAPEGSNLAGSPLFPPLLHELIRTLRRTTDADLNSPGRPWTLDVSAPSLPGSTASETPFSVLSPDAKPLPVTVLSRGRIVRLSLPPVPLPGNYPVRLESLPTPLDFGVVNVHPDESDTRFLDPADLADRSAPDSPTVAVLDDEGSVLSAGSPTALWPHLTALAALFFAAEMLLLATWPHSARSRQTRLSSFSGGHSR